MGYVRKGWFLLIAILISLSGCGVKQQTEESKQKKQAASSSEQQQAEQNKPKEKTDSVGVKQDTKESEPKVQTEISGKTADDDNQVNIGDNGEIIIDFEIEKGTNKVIWHIPGADGLLQMSVGQTLKLHHKNMDPDQQLKILVSADTLSIDEVPHEGRVEIPVEEYTVRAIKKGQGIITIAPNADLQFGDKFGINIK